MKKLFILLLSAMMVFCLTACGEKSEPEPDVMTPEKVKKIICEPSKWTYTSPDGTAGIHTFFEDNKMYLEVGPLKIDDATYEIDDELTIACHYEYDGTKYGASYKLLEKDGGYVLQNVKHPETEWTPAD